MPFFQKPSQNRRGLSSVITELESLCRMIFAVNTEERTLISFPSKKEAVAHCEGLDVEAACGFFGATVANQSNRNSQFQTSEDFQSCETVLTLLSLHRQITTRY